MSLLWKREVRGTMCAIFRCWFLLSLVLPAHQWGWCLHAKGGKDWVGKRGQDKQNRKWLDPLIARNFIF
jgi:hypothetical protein